MRAPAVTPHRHARFVPLVRDNSGCLVIANPASGGGTLNEIVNGLMQAGTTNPLPAVGIVPSGTGSDFGRSLGVRHRLEEACLRLAVPKTVSRDLGVISFDGGEAAPSRRCVVFRPASNSYPGPFPSSADDGDSSWTTRINYDG